MDPAVPLVVPENQSATVHGNRDPRQPNCWRHHSITPLWPITSAQPLTRLMLENYSSASGAGAGREARAATSPTRAYSRGRDLPAKVLPAPVCVQSLRHNTSIEPSPAQRGGDTKVIQGDQQDLWRFTQSGVGNCVR